MRNSIALRRARSAQLSGRIVAFVLAPLAGLVTLIEFSRTGNVVVVLVGCIATFATLLVGRWSIRFGKKRQTEIEGVAEFAGNDE